MKRFVCFLVIGCMLLASLVACDFAGNNGTSSFSQTENVSSATENFPVTVRDVTIGAKPTRVVSLSPVLTDLICGYGYEDRLVGRSSNCISSTSVMRLTDVGTAAEPKIEDIIKLLPEYVFTTQPLSEDATMWLSKNNIAVICLPHPTSIKELTGIYSDLAVIFEGKTDGILQGARNAKAFTDKLDEIRQKIEKYRRDNGASEAVSIMIIHALDNYIAAGSTIEHEILEYIGIGNAAEDSVGYYVSDEALKSMNPHYIVVANSVDKDALSTKSAYKVKTAVKQGNIISIDTTNIERCSVNMLSTFLEILEVMYPGISDVDLTVSQ